MKKSDRACGAGDSMIYRTASGSERIKSRRRQEYLPSRAAKSANRFNPLATARGSVPLSPAARAERTAMIRKISSRQIAQLLVMLTCAWSLKWFYSTATVDQLRWILWPTTKLVELVTGAQFGFESRAGYMNSEHTFLIAASCAGVNFLITAFVMLALRKLWKDRNEKTAWRLIPIAAVLAFVATIVTNTVRISLALQMLETQRRNRWLNAEDTHRLEGILVYFGFLLLLFVVADEVDRRLGGTREERAGIAGFFRFVFALAVNCSAALEGPFVKCAVGRRGLLGKARVLAVV